jgi:hypothetical protein
MPAARCGLFSYARAVFDRVPVLERSIVARRRRDADARFRLRAGRLSRAGRRRCAGMRARVVVCDELAFYRSSRAIRPTSRCCGGAADTGHDGRAARDPQSRRMRRPARCTTPPPPLRPRRCAGARLAGQRRPHEPDAAGGLSRSGWSRRTPRRTAPRCSASFAPASRRCSTRTPSRRAWRGHARARPEPGVRMSSFIDAASGSGKDAFTVAIAHRDGDAAVLDVVRAWRPPFNPSGVIAEAAALLTLRAAPTRGRPVRAGLRVSEGFRRTASGTSRATATGPRSIWSCCRP